MATQDRDATMRENDWLDRALQGTSPATKARVLDMMLRYGIEPENEFFMIFVAIGQLIALTETAPATWQDLFTTFQDDLAQWTTTHRTTLELLATKAETSEQLAETAQALTKALLELTQALSEQQQRSKKIDALLTRSMSGLSPSTPDAPSGIIRFTTAPSKTPPSAGNMSNTWTNRPSTVSNNGARNGIVNLCLILSLIAIGAGIVGLWHGQQQLLQRLEQLEQRV